VDVAEFVDFLLIVFVESIINFTEVLKRLDVKEQIKAIW